MVLVTLLYPSVTVWKPLKTFLISDLYWLKKSRPPVSFFDAPLIYSGCVNIYLWSDLLCKGGGEYFNDGFFYNKCMNKLYTFMIWVWWLRWCGVIAILITQGKIGRWVLILNSRFIEKKIHATTALIIYSIIKKV